MNPLTLVKRLQNITAKEADLGISEEASWHAKYKHSAYVFIGGLPFDLTEGDILAVFAQYGEIVDVNLVRDKGTGKSKGFAFLAYEDQRSTILAVDNLNGAQIMGRTIRVDHCEKYKKKEEEDEEEEKKKREARGVCYAFQRGECTRGAGCRFSHDEQRAANTGWGPQDNKSSRWGNDKFEGSKKGEKSFGRQERADQEGFRPGRTEKALEKSDGREGKRSRRFDDKDGPSSRENYDRREDRRSRRQNDDVDDLSQDDRYRREEKRSRRHDDGDFEPRSGEDRYRRDEKISRRDDDDEYGEKLREDHRRRDEKRSKRHADDEFERRSNRDHDRRG
ncbi:hypothetical protein COLO4_19142 [Corchorus olitorius]|uniref:Zinc finger, CCCH-type n=1 Tax=Corchorus olitorius TaxID=93759 RepID=A0A1R3J6Q4_9ROSI|nr:hypothetical protein COLO4_19142 [Corchorus olitorius]